MRLPWIASDSVTPDLIAEVTAVAGTTANTRDSITFRMLEHGEDITDTLIEAHLYFENGVLHHGTWLADAGSGLRRDASFDVDETPIPDDTQSR